MTVAEQMRYAHDFFNRALDIMEGKGSDYATPDGTAFGDLLEIAKDCQMLPSKVAFIHAMKHWSAIKRAANGQNLRTESIEERLLDLANYAVILSIAFNTLDVAHMHPCDEVVPSAGLEHSDAMTGTATGSKPESDRSARNLTKANVRFEPSDG